MVCTQNATINDLMFLLYENMMCNWIAKGFHNCIANAKQKKLFVLLVNMFSLGNNGDVNDKHIFSKKLV